MKSINPATGETIKNYAETTPEHVKEIIEKTHVAFQEWRKTAFADRAGLMRRAARILSNNADEYARLMAREMGKPIASGRSEANKCAWVCDYYAEHAESFLQQEVIETDARKSFVTFEVRT